MSILKEISLKPATEWMVSADMTAAAKAQMSSDELIGRYLIARYKADWDEVWKAWPLRYAEAQPFLLRGRDLLEREEVSGNPLAELVLSAYRARSIIARVDRHLAALRTIEAIRDYAASHHGKLPTALTDVTALPIPVDPVTGRSFDYRKVGSVGTINTLCDGGHTRRRWKLRINREIDIQSNC